jgi:hypothetical protein
MVKCGAGVLALAITSAALAQSNGDNNGGRGGQQSSSSSSGGSSAARAPAYTVPLPNGGPVPMGADRAPQPPPAPRDRDPHPIPARPPVRKIAPDNFNRGPGNYNRFPDNFNRTPDNFNRTPDNFNNRPPSDSAPDADRGPGDHSDRGGRGGFDHDRPHHRRPYYFYDPWVYVPYRPYDGYVPYDDRYRPYDDGYRGWDDDRGYSPEPVDTRNGADKADSTPPGGLLPPEDLMDDADQPPALRKALETSAAYREATADLLRAWADYARASEQVLQRLRGEPGYRKAQADLRDAEAKVAALRDRAAAVPAVNLVSAAQQAMMARQTVRMLEQKAIDADPTARKAKQQVDQALERRKKVRDEIAAKLPAGAE